MTSPNPPSNSSASSFTHLDAYLKEIPELKSKAVNLQLGELYGAKVTSTDTVNRIVSPLDSVETLEDLSQALHRVEQNANRLNVFREFRVNMTPQIDPDEDSVNIVLDVECEEMKPTTPQMQFGVEKNSFQETNARNGLYFQNMLGHAERVGVHALANRRKAFELGASVELPLIDYQGIDTLKLTGSFGKELSSLTKNSLSNYYTHAQMSAKLIGNHHLQWNLKRRHSDKYNVLHSLSYNYFWDTTTKHPVTGLREKGLYSSLDCTMATFNSNPKFVKTQVSSNAYVPIRPLSSVASFHMNIAGMQPLNTNYSASTFSKLNDKIHPTDRLYTSVRGYDVLGGQKTASTSQQPSMSSRHEEPIGGNFSVNVAARLSAPLKFMGLVYDISKVHGHAFVQAGNVVPLDFEKGDIERAHSRFVNTAKASCGAGLFMMMQNLRFELNYCKKLAINSSSESDRFSGLQFHVETEF